MTETATAPSAEPTAPAPQPRPTRRRRLRPRLVLAKLHRWASFTLGIALLLVTISGTVLLLEPEIEQLTHPSLYDSAAGPRQVGPREALATVRKELPDFNLAGASVVDNRGAWEVVDEEEHVARVDDTSGELLGTITRGGGVIGFISNLHTCALGCEESPGYIEFLGKPAQIDGFDLSLGNEGTWGGFILAVTALLLLALSLSGLALWWPGRRRLPRGLKVRMKKGKYKLNYDLHKVAGLIALPFLLMWAVTGMLFEFPEQMNAVWYALTPGSAPAEAEFASKPVKGKSIGEDEARAIAYEQVPGGSTLISISNPDKSEPESSYEYWFAHGVDPYRYGPWPGNYGVAVDRYTGRTHMWMPEQEDRSLTAAIWQDWTYALHYGYPVGWIPRLAWVGFGLAPLLLVITGVTTWWIRRRPGRGRGGKEPPGGQQGQTLI
jgi:uncharacterized iron-regulated membrane protein